KEDSIARRENWHAIRLIPRRSAVPRAPVVGRARSGCRVERWRYRMMRPCETDCQSQNPMFEIASAIGFEPAHSTLRHEDDPVILRRPLPPQGIDVSDPSDALQSERLRIREIVENWAVWRDAGDWDRFRNVWHAD